MAFDLLDTCESSVARLAGDYLGVRRWSLHGEALEPDDLGARDCFLPVFVRLAADTATAAGLIDAAEQFPLVSRPQPDSACGFEVHANDASPLSAATALLFVTDALYYSLSLTDRPRLDSHHEASLDALIQPAETDHVHTRPTV